MSLRSVLLSIPIVILSVTWIYSFQKNSISKRIYRAPVSISNFTGHGIIDRSIQIKLKEDRKTQLDQEPVSINVGIEVPFDFEGPLEYKWLLGENVILDTGLLQGNVTNLKANQKQTLQIRVRGFSQKENRHVSFQIAGIKNGRKIYADGIVASRKEQTFENVVQNVEKLRAERNQE